MTDWKPGDVAMVTVKGREAFCTFYDTGAERGWFHGLGLVTNHYVARADEVSARPLVVIDPEDAEQVREFADIYARSQGLGGAGPNITRHLTAALREFARPTPPKPDEPTGLGAVVEDAGGKKWVHADPDDDGDLSWYRQHDGAWERWKTVNAVRVLSEGVTA